MVTDRARPGPAAAAVASLALTVLSSVRRRRHELALLKALGMTRGQLRSVIAWQTTLTLLIAVAIGGPLGVAGVSWPGGDFAGSLGAMPASEIPVAGLVLGLLALVPGRQPALRRARGPRRPHPPCHRPARPR